MLVLLFCGGGCLIEGLEGRFNSFGGGVGSELKMSVGVAVSN